MPIYILLDKGLLSQRAIGYKQKHGDLSCSSCRPAQALSPLSHGLRAPNEEGYYDRLVINIMLAISSQF